MKPYKYKDDKFFIQYKQSGYECMSFDSIIFL